VRLSLVGDEESMLKVYTVWQTCKRSLNVHDTSHVGQ